MSGGSNCAAARPVVMASASWWSRALQSCRLPRFAGVNVTFENLKIRCFDADGTQIDRAEAELARFLRDGKLRGVVNIRRGSLEDVPRAFIHMMIGGNTGKQLVELINEDSAMDEAFGE
eukprot:NODE_25859_length_573_cov_1.986547.p1 GENE.NODE_25859_length_573_cov_1.986547~~NODE_25859_length_573_cov_1.986547.p1  ORF type:complete len:139 (-),score=29.05 NODE_25859_length_573_cov_1.986547:157-513(-)